MAEDRVCSIPDCGKPSAARGWCQGHYVRWKKHGDPERGGALNVRRQTCSIEGCAERHMAQGYCTTHYQRFRSKGEAGRAERRPYGQALQWLIDRVDHSGEECLTWPFSTNELGYPQLNNGGKIERAHRRMCILAHGEPPFPDAQACHSCGNGHFACVNPRHLRWGTRKENQQDMVAHGRSNRGAKNPNTKITQQDVLALCAAFDAGESQYSIAARYGIKQSTVSAIVLGKNWGWLTGRKPTARFE